MKNKILLLSLIAGCNGLSAHAAVDHIFCFSTGPVNGNINVIYDVSNNQTVDDTLTPLNQGKYEGLQLRIQLERTSDWKNHQMNIFHADFTVPFVNDGKTACPGNCPDRKMVLHSMASLTSDPVDSAPLVEVNTDVGIGYICQTIDSANVSQYQSMWGAKARSNHSKR